MMRKHKASLIWEWAKSRTSRKSKATIELHKMPNINKISNGKPWEVVAEYSSNNNNNSSNNSNKLI